MRRVQVLFCARVLRDETTVRWLEEFEGHYGLDDLHHCDALKVSSEIYLKKMLREAPIVITVKKPIPGRTTNTNPYIKRKYFTYDVEIVPRHIARRIFVSFCVVPQSRLSLSSESLLTREIGLDCTGR